MQRTTATWVLLGSLTMAACSGANDDVQARETAAETASATQEVQANEPTMERLMARATERLDVMCSGDWIEVYDYVHPKTKEWMTIYQFLEGKDNHAYAEPTAPQVIARDGDTVYLSATALWTPKHPVLSQVDNVPEGWDPTERIEWIETWDFADGDWHMQWPQQYPSDFFEQHPELLKKSKPAGDDHEVAQADGR